MAVNVEIPEVGESVTEVILVEWLKSDGDYVQKDEPICVLETDKADIELPAPASGALSRISKEGETIEVGGNVATIDDNAEKSTAKKSAVKEAPKPEAKQEPKQKEEGMSSQKQEASGQTKAPEQPREQTQLETKDNGKKAAVAEPELSPAVRRIVEEFELDPSEINGSGKDGRLTKEDVMRYVKEGVSGRSKPEGKEKDSVSKEKPTSPKPVENKSDDKPVASPESVDEGAIQFDQDGTKRVALTKIRKKIAERLVKAQQTAALLTTFNEIDMKALLDLRKKYKESFENKHGVGLGMMSFFARACVYALEECPRMNAFLDDDEIVYHQNINMGIAVSTDRGLVVPVVHNTNEMSLAKIELEIRRLATAAREGKLGINDLSGGTFSITNGGVFGSLLSTPIINMPQSGILGMHTIQERPVVVKGQIEIRPMMYVALTYDHRMIDGKEAVTFLVRVKQMIEDPARLLLEV